MTLTIGSMFSGYGGLDMAIEAVTGAQQGASALRELLEMVNA